MEKVNSKEYWEERFVSGDWDHYDGDLQSTFFSQIALDAFPAWLDQELARHEWTVFDVGCAEGGGTAALARRFPSCHTVGIDVSETAVKRAGKKYPFCQFLQGDVYTQKKTADVIFVSNVLEHLQSPAENMRSLVGMAKCHAILIHPLHDTLALDEHFHVFDEEFFPLRIGDHVLSHFKIIDCGRRNSPYWPGEQILVVYSRESVLPEDRRLSDLFDNSEYYALKHGKTAALAELQGKLEQQVMAAETERNAHRKALDEMEKSGREAVSHLEHQLMKQNEQTAALQRQLTEKDGQTAALQRQLTEQDEQTAALQRQLTEEDKHTASLQRLLTEENEQTASLRQQLTENCEQMKALQEDLEAREEELLRTDSEKRSLQKKLARSEKRNADALRQLDDMTRSRLFKLVHLFNRILHQSFHKDKAERRKFRKWIMGRFRHIPDMDHRYNPLFSVISLLTGQNDALDDQEISDLPAEPERQNEQVKLPEQVCACIDDDYVKYDVIVFSVIDYHFRYQRPQQIADHFAREGHRVFYINANFSPSGKPVISEIKDGLWQVVLPNSLHGAVYSTNFEDAGADINALLDQIVFENGIRDALLIADYPNWVSGMLYLKKRYGFTLVTDYMDDYSGFDNAEERFIEEACVKLLRESDMVAASSNYLGEIAKKYNANVEIIRNGTEFAHFYQAYGEGSSEKKAIGYYGAIAHWFDFEKIEYLSERFPETDIVLIGSVTDGEARLKKLKNVRLLGEKPYSELPQYLGGFDVCLIPFDASTSLIQATNPVKFYEYLSAGKKVVATEIPELEPFKDRYVYLANDNRTFGDYVEACLKGEDALADPQACMEFTKENDWSVRVSQFSLTAERQFPKISIVVLCYNQLDYTKKCVQSILKQTAYPNYELVLVDNASVDETAGYLKEIEALHENIKVVLNTTNRGFAGGNNDGIRASTGEYIVLLNNDTVVTRGWLTGMVKRFLAGEKKIGIVGPVTNSIGNEAMVRVGYTGLENMPAAAYAYTAGHMGMTYPHDGVLAMFCVMFPRKLTDEIGLLDEHYGIGMFEDDDYSIAAQRAGYENLLVEDVFIHHFGSVSFKKLENAEYRKIFDANRSYFENKWNVKWKMHHYRPDVAANISNI